MEQAVEKVSLFTTPRRQSPVDVFVESAVAFKNILKRWWLLFIYIIIKASSDSIPVIAAGTIVIIVLIIGYGYLLYRNFIFSIDEERDEFVLEQGVFNKKRLTIQLERIQQVEISQNLIQKLLNVYSLEIDTAGSQKSEVVIKAVSLTDAQLLKSRLLSVTTHTEPVLYGSIPLDYGKIQLSFSTLIKTSATSNYLKTFALIIAFLGSSYNILNDVLRISKTSEQEFRQLFQWESLYQYVGFLVMATILFVVLFNLIRGVLVYYGYKITFNKESLDINYGLLKTKSIIVYADKVQRIEVVSNYLQKKLKLRRLLFYQASPNVHADKKSMIELPGCTVEQEQHLVNYLFGKISEAGTILIPSRRKMVFPVLFGIMIPCFLVIGMAFFYGNYFLYNIVAVWILLAITMVYFHYKNSRLCVAGDHILIHSGIWDVSMNILPAFKIQRISVKQKLWHRKAGIAHITLHTAAGPISFKFAYLKELTPLVNKWLYDVETNHKKWM